MWAPTANNLDPTCNNSYSIPSPELIENMAHLCGFLSQILHTKFNILIHVKGELENFENAAFGKYMLIESQLSQWQQFMSMLFVAYVILYLYFQLIDLRESLKSLNSKCYLMINFCLIFSLLPKQKFLDLGSTG